MQIIIDDKKIKRKTLLSNILTFGGLGILGLCLYLSYQDINTIIYSGLMGGLLVGLLAFQIGMDMKTRWSRRPRMDEILSGSLKGLPSQYTVAHYVLGAKHVLLSPGGIFVLVPVYEKGEIIFEKGEPIKKKGKLVYKNGEIVLADDKWYAVQTGKRRTRKRYLTAPDVEAKREVSALQKKLSSIFNTTDALNIEPVLVFVHSDARLNLPEVPMKAVHVKKIKPYLRKLPRGNSLSAQQVKTISTGMSVE